MNQLQLFHETLATYRKYGWRLERVLMREATLAQLREAGEGGDVLRFENVAVAPAMFDAIWVARPSHQGREAWELRLIAETPYALFEVFEADEEEEDRDDVRREMEARMREYVNA